MKVNDATTRFAMTALVILISLGNFFPGFAQDKEKATSLRTGERPQRGQIYASEGVSVEFSIEPLGSTKTNSAELAAGTEATVRFKITDARQGEPLSKLRPTAWIDRRDPAQPTGARECREKIQSFLQPGFNRRASIDLNTYFILTLNNEPNISVIDPLSGFGGTKLYTLVPLPSSGEDWELSADKKRLYVSTPLAGKVVVIDTAAWKVIATIDAGAKPSRLVLQHDEKYLWVGNDSPEEGAVTVIDTATLKAAARFKTGAGHHEIALAEDDSSAFITNSLSGSLSVIDVRKLVQKKELKIGARPSSLAYSTLSRTIYVTSEGDGTIVAVDASKSEIVARMKAQSGLNAIRIPPTGRFGFALNPVSGTAFIFEVSSNRLIRAVSVGPGIDQISFTRQFAYVRSPESEFVTMIKLADFAKAEKEVAITHFPAGEKAPKGSPARSLADFIVPAPEEGAVLVANPADKMIYYYSEGMAAPMGSFQNYRRDPKALLVLDNSLTETARGIYTTTVRLTNAGRYDVAFLLDSPRLVNCFDMTIAENPALPDQNVVPIKIEPLASGSTARVGESFSVRFRVIDSKTSKTKTDLKDVGVLVFLAPGTWQQRGWAKSLGDGAYETSFVPPQAGVYYVYFQCPSLGVNLNQITPLTVEITQR